MKNSSDTIGNETRDLRAGSAVSIKKNHKQINRIRHLRPIDT